MKEKFSKESKTSIFQSYLYTIVKIGFTFNA